jgi:WD40-like Beta Propeller Repeat
LTFTPELTAGIARTNARLSEEAPVTVDENGGNRRFGLYLDRFDTETYGYVGETTADAVGASSQLNRVVFGGVGELGNGLIREWEAGKVSQVNINNDGEQVNATVGSAIPSESETLNKDAWHAVSGEGTDVLFTSPGLELLRGTSEGAVPLNGQLYDRVNADQHQSDQHEASGTATLEEGSSVVSAVTTGEGYAYMEKGDTKATLAITTAGEFLVGDEVTGTNIASETTITSVEAGEGEGKEQEEHVIGLSKPATGSNPGESVRIAVTGDSTELSAGESITGGGIQEGTTVKTVGTGTLTLSKPAASSGTAVPFSAGGGCTVSSDACTVDVSASQRFLQGNPAGQQPARYWGASADGSKVFFTSNAELTEDAYTGTSAENSANLYEYDLETGKLHDLTGEKSDASGVGAAVQGVVQISEEGQYVYFVAKGALKGENGETLRNASGAEPVEEEGKYNLYVSYEGRVPAFITTLGGSDESDWNNGSYPGEASPEVNTAAVSPDGTWMAFLSRRELTGYDNHDANKTNTTDNEMYLYDAETGKLTCASCNPTGARPVGSAKFYPFVLHGFAQYRPRNLLDDGALFFDSADALVPAASGGQTNVYEYTGGHVDAISTVTGRYESFFVDASPNGENVFFGTANPLLSKEGGGNIAIYDARVDGGSPASVAAPSCDDADSCKPPESPQPAIFGSPSSATFSGPGNATPPVAATVTPKKKTAAELRAEKLAKALKSCRTKKDKQKRQACEKQARAKYGPTKPKTKKAKKTSNDRRNK